MNLYRTKYSKDVSEDGTKFEKGFSWTGSLSDASKDRVRLKKEGCEDVHTDPVDVPTDKAGLMAFLNASTQ